MPTAADVLLQAMAAALYYTALVGMIRLAGKRLAGQTTTFDLIVLISLAVVLQKIALLEGLGNALVFVVTVFIAHILTARACRHFPRFKRLVRGVPRPLVLNGRVIHAALEDEGLTYEDLVAGCRKVGLPGPAGVALATLEETGQISIVPAADPDPVQPGPVQPGKPAPS